MRPEPRLADNPQPTVEDLLELARLVEAAPHAADDVDALMRLLERGQISIETVKHLAQQLAVLH